MFNGKCKIWREGDNLHAMMILPTPSGPVEWKETVKGDLDDGAALERLKRKAKWVAGFFPTQEIVGAEIMSEAEEIRRSFLDPETREQARAQVFEILHSQVDQDENDEGAEDLGYVLERMARSDREKLGSWFSRAFKTVSSPVKWGAKLAVMPISFVARTSLAVAKGAGGAFYAALPWRPPNPFVNRLAQAAKDQVPAAMEKIQNLSDLATIPPEAIKDESGRPLPPGEAARVQSRAAEALDNIEEASYYGEDDWQYDEQEDDSIGIDLYRRGADLSLEDIDNLPEETQEELAGLFDFVKSLGDKIGPMVDPTRPGFVRNTLESLPGVGEKLKSANALLDAAKKGHPEAVDRVKTIKDLADAGVPKAKEALENLKIAQNLQNRMQAEVAAQTNPGKMTWFPGWKFYRWGAMSPA